MAKPEMTPALAAARNKHITLLDMVRREAVTHELGRLTALLMLYEMASQEAVRDGYNSTTKSAAAYRALREAILGAR